MFSVILSHRVSRNVCECYAVIPKSACSLICRYLSYHGTKYKRDSAYNPGRRLLIQSWQEKRGGMGKEGEVSVCLRLPCAPCTPYIPENSTTKLGVEGFFSSVISPSSVFFFFLPICICIFFLVLFGLIYFRFLYSIFTFEPHDLLPPPLTFRTTLSFCENRTSKHEARPRQSVITAKPLSRFATPTVSILPANSSAVPEIRAIGVLHGGQPYGP